MANRFDQLIDEWDGRLQRAFREAIDHLRDQAQIEQVARMLEAGDVDGALRAVGLDPVAFRAWDKTFLNAYEAGGIATATAIPPQRDAQGFRVVIRFNVRNPQAEQWLRQHSSQFITDVMDDQRQMIRDALQIGLSKGLNPRNVALDIVGRVNARGVRSGGLIGLTRTQAQWVANYAEELATDPAASLKRVLRDKRFDRLVARHVKDETPIPADVRQKMVTAYENRALRLRGETIARKEAITALHAAQENAIDQAVANGQIDAQAVTFKWHTAHDDRVRGTHIPMDGQVRAYSQPFVTGAGVHLDYPGDPNGPPAEVINCRCWREPKIDFLRGIR